MEDNKKRNPEKEEASNDTNDKKSGNAANLDAIISSPTDAVRSRRTTDGWSHQGTNISYEGQTAPGGSGSVGTGEASGGTATGARISSSEAYDHAHPERNRDEKKESEEHSEDDADTLGNP